MKNKFFLISLFLFSGTFLFAQEYEIPSEEKIEKAAGDIAEIVFEASEKSVEETAEDVIEVVEELFKKDKAAKAKPAKKRPKAVDAEKAEAAAKKDESEKTVEEYRNTIRYGISSEISDLVDKLNSNEDPRFADDLYDLFQVSRSTETKEKILNYFQKIEDPCLSDYAVEVLSDPFDQKNSTVKACFQYVRAVKCTEALEPVMRLIENENEDYFNDSLLAIGDLGGPDEAVKLSEYIDKPELTDAQKQSLMKTLGKIHAVETFDKMVEIAENEDENLFVRMYAAEALGAMEKDESVPVLVKLYETNDPNLRQYVIKGLGYFPEVIEAKSVIIQAVRDEHYKVRLEAIETVKKQEMKEAVPYITYRAKNDPEEKVKLTCYEVLAFMNTAEGNEFLIERLTERKESDSHKSKACEVLLKEGHTGKKEISELALSVAQDDKRKSLRAALGKHLSKYPDEMFSEVCIKYLESKDATTQGQGLEMYQNGKYADAVPAVKKLAEDKKANTSNRRRAQRLMGMEEE